MLEFALASLALAFGLSVALNLLQSKIVGRQKRTIDGLEDQLLHLNAAIGGVER